MNDVVYMGFFSFFKEEDLIFNFNCSPLPFSFEGMLFFYFDFSDYIVLLLRVLLRSFLSRVLIAFVVERARDGGHSEPLSGFVGD